MAIALRDEQGFDRSVLTYEAALNDGGSKVQLVEPASAMAGFLVDVAQRSRGDAIARAAGRVLVRAAQSGDPQQVRALIKPWSELVGRYPTAVGTEMDTAVVRAAAVVLDRFVRSAEQTVPNSWAADVTAETCGNGHLRMWLNTLEASSEAEWIEVQRWRDALTSAPADTKAKMAAEAYARATTVWTLPDWKKSLRFTRSRPHFASSWFNYSILAIGWTGLTLFALSASVERVIKEVILGFFIINVPSLAVVAFVLQNYLSVKRYKPDEKGDSVTLAETILGRITFLKSLNEYLKPLANA